MRCRWISPDYFCLIWLISIYPFPMIWLKWRKIAIRFSNVLIGKLEFVSRKMARQAHLWQCFATFLAETYHCHHQIFNLFLSLSNLLSTIFFLKILSWKLDGEFLQDKTWWIYKKAFMLPKKMKKIIDNDRVFILLMFFLLWIYELTKCDSALNVPFSNHRWITRSAKTFLSIQTFFSENIFLNASKTISWNDEFNNKKKKSNKQTYNIQYR